MSEPDNYLKHFRNLLLLQCGKVRVMLKFKIFSILLVSLVHFGQLKATYKQEIYQSYINRDRVRWQKTIDAMDLQKNKSHDFTLELINYQYGFIGWSIELKQNTLAERYLDKAENYLKMLEKSNYQPSMIKSYRSAFYGFRTSLSKIQAPILGPKSLGSAEDAIKLDPKNPFGYVQYANVQFYMPSLFGGSKTTSLDYYRKAEKMMETNKAQLAGDWNYLNLLTMIAKAYIELNQKNMAKAYYEKLLKFEPGYAWVKNELYPKLLKSMK